MRYRTVLTLVVVASLLTIGAVGPAVADPNAGASGNCDEDQKRDGPSVELAQSPDATGPGEVQTTATELARFFQNKAQDPQGENACDGEDGPSDDADGTQGDDYIEAHASGGGQGIQVCYSDNNDASSPSQENVNQGHTHTGYCS